MRNLLIFIAIAALSLTAVSCAKKEAQEIKKAGETIIKEVKMVKPEKSKLAIEIREGATLASDEKTTIPADVAGNVIQWFVSENQRVVKGQVLAKLDSIDNEISLQQAEEALNSLKTQMSGTEKTYNRNKTLMEQGTVSKQAFEQIETAFESLKNQVASQEKAIELMKRRIAYSNVKAPFDGILTKRMASLGAAVDFKKPIAAMEKTDRLKSFINLSETFYSEIKKDSPITFFIPSLNRTVEAKISSVGDTLDDAKTFTVITYVDNTKAKLPAGIYAVAKIKTTEKERVIVPPTAIRNFGDREGAVYTVKDGKVIQLKVYLGFPFEQGIEIIAEQIPETVIKDISGVQLGETVKAVN